MLKLKDLLKEWNDTSFRDLPKRWSKPVMKGREPDGLTEFERIGGTDVELGKVYTDIDRPPFKTESTIFRSAFIINGFQWSSKYIKTSVNYRIEYIG